MRTTCLKRTAVLFALMALCVFAAAPSRAQDAPAAAPAPATAAASASTASDAGDAVAKIDGEVVTKKEYDRAVDGVRRMMQTQAMRSGQAPTAGGPHLTADNKKELLDQMVQGKILLLMARKSGVTVGDEEVAEQVKAFKGRFPSEQVMKSVLAQQGVTLDSLDAQVRDQMTVQKFVEQLTKDIKVDPAEMQTQYDKLKGEGKLDRKDVSYDVAHILIRVPDGADDAAWAAAKEKIDAARKRIVGGEDFGKVAAEVSDDPGSKQNGGAYPGTPKGRMVPEFDKVMAETPVGQVSEPFKTKFGWHILTVTGKHEPGTATLEEVKEPLEMSLKQPKIQEKVESAIAEARKEMNVQILYTPEDDPAPAQPSVTLPNAAPGQGTTAPAPAAPPLEGAS